MADSTALHPLLVILNRGSGKQDCGLLADRLRALARDAGKVCEVRLVRGRKEISAAIDEARTGPYPRVVAGGGDGTLNAVASVITGTDKEFAVLPLGTFNYFAREFGIPQEIDSAFQLCLHGEARPIHIGDLNGIIFLNNASIGIYPRILEVREENYRKWGRSRLVAYWSVLRTLLRFHVNLRAEISVADAPPMRLSTPMIFVGRNSVQLEEFRLPGPECVQNEHLSAYVLPPASRGRLVTLALRMVLGKLRPREDLKPFCASELKVRLLPGKWSAAIDGERRTVSSPFTFSVRSNGLRAVLP